MQEFDLQTVFSQKLSSDLKDDNSRTLCAPCASLRAWLTQESGINYT
jgi:hypothetical protein